MSVRMDNIAKVALFLRNRVDKARKTVDSLDSMTFSQRSAVITSADYAKETQTKFSLKEISDGTGIPYHKVRYALVGAKPHHILNKQQPPELQALGIRVHYHLGTSNPIFEFDGEMLYHSARAAVHKTEDVIISPQSDKHEPDPRVVTPDTNEPEPPVVNNTDPDLCDLVHVRKWLMKVVTKQFNVNDLGMDENGVITVNGSPLVGMMFVSADKAAELGYSVDDVTAIQYDEDYAKKEDLPS